MQKIIIYTVVLFLSFLVKMQAQNTFEYEAKKIADQIEAISTEEKQALKEEVEKINQMVENGTLTLAEAEDAKIKAANMRANNIEERVKEQNLKLAALVQDKVDGKLATSEDKDQNIIQIGKSSIYIKIDNENKDTLKIKQRKGDRRTTSQFVLAFGLNNHIIDGDWASLEDSEFEAVGSRFLEWGVAWKSRLAKNNNLLHAKYGFSVMYNTVRPKGNQSFVVDGNQTNLEESALDLRKSRFKNVQLVFPVHLEFDFTPKKTAKDGSTYFKTQKSFRFGVGGYAGVNLKTKQILKTNDSGSNKIKEKGDFNASDFIYGLSTYVGYRSTSLYLKYDLNPVFRSNPIDRNNVSLGLRFDFN
uniref:hypothetical protein n=1 Tax=Flavobacterium sp. TaxID=239 RepID=UPI00404A6CF2